MTCADDPYVMWNRFYNVGTAFFGGLGTGSKAVANGLTSAGVQTVTLGQCDYQLLEVTEYDEANGYGTSAAIAKASGDLLITAGTLGVGCPASQASTLGKGAAVTLQVLDGATAAKDVAEGGLDMYENGVTFENSLKVASGGVSLYSLKVGEKCFTAGTQVVVGLGYDADGNVLYDTKNIEDIQVGDLVYSYDTATGEYGYREVTNTFVRESDHINQLRIVDEQGREQTLETTDGHPFWVVTDEPDLSRAASSVVDENGVILYHDNLEPGLNGYWVEAKDLRVGDVFLGADGNLSTLQSTLRVEQDGSVAVFNFTVEGNHDYFVLEKDYQYGQTCVLVHNAGGVYELIDKNTGEVVRTGRTNDLARRQAEHFRDPELGKYDFKPLYATDNYAQQRGLEQFAHELYDPPLNKIRPISPTNPKRPVYTEAAKDFLGQ